MEEAEKRETFRIWSQKAVLCDASDPLPAGIMDKVKCGTWMADMLSYNGSRKDRMEDYLVLACCSAVKNTEDITDWEELAQDLDIITGKILFCDAKEIPKRAPHFQRWYESFKEDLESTGDAMVRDFDAGAYTASQQGTAKCWVAKDAQSRVIAVKVSLNLLKPKKVTS